MGLLTHKKIKVFGLDISDSTVRALEIHHLGGKLIIAACADNSLSDKAVNNHVILDEDKLAEIIRRTVDKAKINTPYVVCSIPEAKSFVRVVRLPKMAENEIDGAIPYELEQDIPIPIDQVYLDWYTIRETNENLELLVTAAPKDYIDSLVAALRKAKLIPLAFELESQAVARALIDGDNIDKPVLIADMATKNTSFIIVDKGAIEYTSSIQVAGDALTDSIARNLSISKPEAEKMKKTIGLTSESRKSSVRDSIVPILDNVIDEVKNVIRYFEEHDEARRKIDTVLLSGGTAELLGVAEYVSTRINLGSTVSNIQVVLGNPLMKVGNMVDERAAKTIREGILGFTTVIGLALRDIDYQPRFNL